MKANTQQNEHLLYSVRDNRTRTWKKITISA